MAGTIKYDPVAIVTLLDDTAVSGAASLTSLAAGSAVLSAAQDNTASTGRADFWADFELIIYFGVSPVAGATVDLYLVAAVDGTNYADAGTGGSPVAVVNHFIGSFPVRNQTTIHRLNLRGVPLPPLKWKAQLINSTAQSFAVQNTGSKLNVVTYREQYT